MTVVTDNEKVARTGVVVRVLRVLFAALTIAALATILTRGLDA